MGETKGTNCCGERQDTPFCAYCGKQLAEPNPLISLLVHVRQRRVFSQKEVQHWSSKERPGGTSAIDVKCNRYVASSHRLLRKWAAWEKALEEIIDSQAVDPEKEKQAQRLAEERGFAERPGSP